MTSEEKDTSSSKDFFEYMANLNDLDNSHTVSSSTDDSSDSEVEIIKELIVKQEDHRCDLCCEGEFLIDRLQRFGGLIDEKHKFVCDKCDKNFMYKSELNKHLTSCSGPMLHRIKLKKGDFMERDPKICSVCHNTFKSQGGLTKHMQSKHSSVIHKCEICKKEFSSFSKFNIHCFEHEQKKHYQFVCLECNKRFVTERGLLKHQALSAHNSN